MRHTERAHAALAPIIGEGDLVVDATAGNGLDTLALARAVGATGSVWAFDIQADALASTRRRVEAAGVGGRVTCIHDSHTRMRDHLPPGAHGALAAVMANLGYLPGGDPAIISTASDTAVFLGEAFALLRPGGVISVLAYPGHDGGDTEAAVVLHSLRGHAESGATLELHGDPHDACRTPWLALLTKYGVKP